MRKKGSVFVLTDGRDRDLLRAYNEQLRKQLRLYGRVCQSLLAEKTVGSPASRFWVSSERACVVVYRMMRGESIGYMNPVKHRFYTALYQAFCRYREEHPQIRYREEHPQMPVKHIVEIVVTQPAPCFPVTARVAKNIIERTRRRCQREKIERLRSK